MGKAILIAALSGALITGAGQTGTYAVHGITKLVHAIHHHVVTPTVKVVKATVTYETKTK